MSGGASGVLEDFSWSGRCIEVVGDLSHVCSGGVSNSMKPEPVEPIDKHAVSSFSQTKYKTR